MLKKLLNKTFEVIAKRYRLAPTSDGSAVDIMQASLDKAYKSIGVTRDHSGLDWTSTLTAVQEMVDSAEAQWRATTKSHEILSEMLRHIGGFAWRRDIEGRYLYVNQSMCSMMLIPDIGILNKDAQIACLDEVKGYTDSELMDAYTERTGQPHGFRDHSKLIDERVRANLKTCRFIQFGKIDGALRVYYTMASPMYSRGQFCGTAGFSIDETPRCDYLKLQLEAMKNSGQLDIVGPGLYLTQVGEADITDECVQF